jgi:hypothetical protein
MQGISFELESIYWFLLSKCEVENGNFTGVGKTGHEISVVVSFPFWVETEELELGYFSPLGTLVLGLEEELLFLVSVWPVSSCKWNRVEQEESQCRK